MARRRGHRIGRWLVEDQETGIVHYDDEMIYRGYDGLLVFGKKNEKELRHPQEFVKAQNDPRGETKVNEEHVLAKPNCGTLYTRIVSAQGGFSQGFNGGFCSQNTRWYILAPEGPGNVFAGTGIGSEIDTFVTAVSVSASAQFSLAYSFEFDAQSSAGPVQIETPRNLGNEMEIECTFIVRADNGQELKSGEAIPSCG